MTLLASTSSGQRRTSIDILLGMLEVLLSSAGPVSMTSLMNRSNLNQVSFERYISMLLQAGVVRRVEAGEAGLQRRKLYEPTPAAKRLYVLLALAKHVLSGSGFAERLESIVERARRELEEAGARVSTRGTILDLVAVTPRGNAIGVIVADPEGTWSLVASMVAGRGSDNIVVYSPEGSPVRLRVVQSLSVLTR